MIPFAVKVKDVTKEGQANWVLAIDAVLERLLIVHEDGSFHWYPMAECTFVKCVPPDQPQMVVPVKPSKGISVPQKFGVKPNGY